MKGHRMRKSLGATLRLIATAAVAISMAALPSNALATGSRAKHTTTTTVIASVTAYATNSHPECNSEYGTSLTVTGTRNPGKKTRWHVKLRGTSYYDCRSGGAEDTVVVDEELQSGEFVVSRHPDRVRLDADVTFGIFLYPEAPLTAPGHLTVEWTPSGATTIERATVRTPAGWTRTTTRECPSTVPTLMATPHVPGVWGDLLLEAQTTAFLRTTKTETLQRR